MTHFTRSLASLLREGLQTLEDRRRGGAGSEDPDYLILSQQSNQASPQSHAKASPTIHGSQAVDSGPTRQEVLNYLGELAKDYHLPPKLVYSVADAESSVNPGIEPQKNYLRDKHHKIVLDKAGNPVVKSYDYGLMQINSARIGHDVVKDPRGHVFKIEENVKNDWKANARAGVATLAPAYHLAELEQGPGATEEDHAQQAYAQYNGGSPRTRERYLKEKRGIPTDGADRNFLKKYREWADQKR